MSTTTSLATDVTAEEQSRVRRAVVASSVGNALEWFDIIVYASFAVVISKLFFPTQQGVTGLLLTFGTFAISYLVRPVGAMVIGAYGDRAGRKQALSLTIFAMMLGTGIMALAPTAASIGAWAGVVLLASRLLQGFSAGGEFGSSSSFLVESAAPQRRAFAGSWQQVSVGAGALLASLMGFVLTSTLSDAAMQSWGWRIAFGVGGLLGLVGLWLRVSVEETQSFRDAHADGRTGRRNPLVGMLVEHPRAALRVVGITIAGTLIYYVWISYMPGFAHTATGIPLREAFLANTIAVAYFLCLLPFVALLSDRYGRKPTLLAFAIGFVVIAYPAFLLIELGGFWPLLVVELVGVTFLAGYSANCAVVMAEQFPAEVRSTGIGLPYALAVALFGGTAPYITTWMSTNGFGGLVWLYVAAGALVGVVVYALMPETAGRELT